MNWYKKYIESARSNPEKNPRETPLYQLKKYIDIPDTYVSFTELPKLGLNPKSPSDFNTPIGIYAYPLKEAWDLYIKERGIGGVPFPEPSSMKYFQVFRPKNPETLLEIGELDKARYNEAYHT